MRLHVLGPLDETQVLQQVLFIARREQRRQQNDVGHPRRDRGDRGVAGVDDLELRIDFVANEVAEQRRLLVIWIRGQV